jgi:hypothetical protein
VSKEQYLFDPRALARVAEHVEWEPELKYYRDGTSNQSYYVKAMVMLLERWLREFTLIDLALALQSAGSGDWPGLIQQGLDTIEEKVTQLRGFWEGLWYGANPKTAKAAFGEGWLYPFNLDPEHVEATAEPVDAQVQVLGILEQFFGRLRELSADFRPPVK